MMKTRFVCSLAVVAMLAACDRRPAGPSPEDLAAERRREEQRVTDEKRVAELRDLEQRAAEREAAERNAATQRERDALARERADLEREKQALQDKMEKDRLAEMRRREEAEARARADRESPVAEPVIGGQTVDLFYDALDPLGDWVEVEGYGYCWRPRAAARFDWRPYTDGRWIFSEYGWTWESNESFGWATYHYGRWTRIRRLGWIWVPGTEWAPAWVSWRRGNDYVGWAPLPPEARGGRDFTARVEVEFGLGAGFYVFLNSADLGEQTYAGRAIAPERNVTIINQTVNVTNTTYKVVDNRKTVYNGGPDITVINQKSRRPVQELKVQRVASGRTEQKGNVLNVVAPEMATTKPARKPDHIAQKFDRADVERNDEVADKPVVRDQPNAPVEDSRPLPTKPQGEKKAKPALEEPDSNIPPKRPQGKDVTKPSLPPSTPSPVPGTPSIPPSGNATSGQPDTPPDSGQHSNPSSFEKPKRPKSENVGRPTGIDESGPKGPNERLKLDRPDRGNRPPVDAPDHNAEAGKRKGKDATNNPPGLKKKNAGPEPNGDEKRE